MTVDTLAGGAVFLVARALFGGVLAFMGLNHFLQADAMAGYADSQGVPAPKLAVLASGALLVVGGASLVAGVLPVVGAAALVAFFAVVTPAMHAFWRVEDSEARQSEMTDFLKNAALAGAALAFLAIGAAEWPLAA